MVNNFVETVKGDINFLSSCLQSESHYSTHSEEKVARAAVRTFAALGMIYAAFKGVFALAACTGVGVVVALGGYGVIYALFHDLFVIHANKERGVIRTAGAFFRSIVDDILDLNSGKKGGQADVPRHPHTEGTFFRPLWDKIYFKQIKQHYSCKFMSQD